MKSSKNSQERIGKWAIYGQSKGIMQGREGKSYGIVTIVKAGQKRSVSLFEIKKQVNELLHFAKINPHLEFLITLFGCHLAGYSVQEIANCFNLNEIKEIHNISLPEEFWNELNKK